MALTDKIYLLATGAVVVSSGSAFVAYASTLSKEEEVAIFSDKETENPVQKEQGTNSSWDWGFQDWPIGRGEGNSNLEWL